MNITLSLYNDYTNIENKNKALELIQGFWLAHNNYQQTIEDAENDFLEWTKSGHNFYFINFDNNKVGFIHLGSRGAKIDWLEDIFVLPTYQNKGIATQAIKLVEEIVKEYSISLYIEAAARNERAIRLYRNLGYDCLNTITIRKDFQNDELIKVRDEKIYDLNFEIRKVK